ncbi:MAG: hypothetical protein KDK53_13330 [Maritimibacter sp.]|nr:hypothetical protein [Sedimentitalea sp.]MCB1357429.1 hypothetical protein [Maritimibacter sp.]
MKHSSVFRQADTSNRWKMGDDAMLPGRSNVASLLERLGSLRPQIDRPKILSIWGETSDAGGREKTLQGVAVIAGFLAEGCQRYEALLERCDLIGAEAVLSASRSWVRVLRGGGVACLDQGNEVSTISKSN